MFKLGDKVRNKSNWSEYGEVVSLSNSGESVRVMMQQPLGKLWWFDCLELEVYE